jgi:hypothetical protein
LLQYIHLIPQHILQTSGVYSKKPLPLHFEHCLVEIVGILY